MARSVPIRSGPRSRPSPAGWRRLASSLATTLWFRATLALLAVYVAILPVGLVVADQERQAMAVAATGRQMGRVASDVQGLETAVLDESAGLRGYVETADARLLGGYDAGRAQARSAWSSLAADARGTAVEAELPALQSAADAWQSWADRSRAETDVSHRPAPSGAGLEEGQGLLNRFQAAAARLEGLAATLVARADAGADGLGRWTVVAGTVGPIAGPASLVIVGSVLLWLALGPVRRLAGAANRLAGGLEPEIPYTRRRDEVGAVARALLSWRQAVASQRLIWQHSPVAMLMFGADLVMRTVNPANLALFRVDPRVLMDRAYMARTVSAATHPDDARPTARMYRRLLAGESETERLEKRYIRSDGSVFWGHCILTLVRDAEGGPDHFVCMIEDITERRERLERAAQVQRDLLPEPLPELEGYELAGICRPSKEMGGDFYDWYRRGPGGLALTVGDVMGKDMPAALLMATVRVALRTSAVQPTVGEAVRWAAASIERDLERAGAFVTLFHGRLELGTGRVTYVDAGHGLVLVVGKGGVRRPGGGRWLPLGVEAGEAYGEVEERLEAGEALVVFSDGVLDVHPELGERLEAAGERLEAAGSAEEMVERLASGPGAAADDVTVVVLRRLPAS
jgi:PAS domain S-box-containing protein